MESWFYRTTETDDDNDPLDWGLVSAADWEAALALVTARLFGILGDDDDTADDYVEVEVKFYRVIGPIGAAGILDSDGPHTEVVALKPPKETR